jgi:hypothetical protein
MALKQLPKVIKRRNKINLGDSKSFITKKEDIQRID